MRRVVPVVTAVAALSLLPVTARSQSHDPADQAPAGTESQPGQPENGKTGKGRTLRASWQDALVLGNSSRGRSLRQQ